MDQSQEPQESQKTARANTTTADPMFEFLRVKSSRLFDYWGQFATPQIPVDNVQVTLEDLDRLRRGRMLSIVLCAALVGDALAFVIILAQTATVQSVTTVSGVFVTIVVAVLWLQCARLNRARQVEVAALLTAAVLAGCILADLLASDLLINGYNWTDPPGWDLMGLSLLIVSLTLRPAVSWLCYLFYMILVLGIVILVPHDSSTLPTAISVGFVSANSPESQQYVYLVIALLYRTAILGVCLTLVGQGSNYCAMQALRERDLAQEIAAARQRKLIEGEVVARERRLQEQWMNECIASLKNSLNRDTPFVEPALSDSWKSNQNLLVFHGLLTTLVRRLQEGQEAFHAIELLQAHVLKLPGLLHYLRTTGEWFEQPHPANEYVLVSQLGGVTGSGSIDSLLSDMNFYFDMLAREESEALSELQMAIADFRRGNLARRADPALLTRRYGSLVHAVNTLLDEVVPAPAAELDVPFAVSERDSSE